MRRCVLSRRSLLLLCAVGARVYRSAAFVACWVSSNVVRPTRPIRRQTAENTRVTRELVPLPAEVPTASLNSSRSHPSTSNGTDVFDSDALAQLLDSVPPPPNNAAIPDDDFTQWIQRTWPLEWQHSLRDSGLLRTLMDSMVVFGLPVLLMNYPNALFDFLRLSNVRFLSRRRRSPTRTPTWLSSVASVSSSNASPILGNRKVDEAFLREFDSASEHEATTLETIRYGPHRLQTLDLISSSHAQQRPHRLILFVHGGAWGSGRPWMYRLVAKMFVNRPDVPTTCAVLGYRTFPDGRIDDQLEDLYLGMKVLSSRYSYVAPTTVTLVGHSSGAHLSLLAILRSIMGHHENGTGHTTSSCASLVKHVQSMILLSGVYDIASHETWERGRGIDEISPMKPACAGECRQQMVESSPTQVLRKLLRPGNNTKDLDNLSLLLPPLWLIHGAEDTVVPYTSTLDFANALQNVPQESQEHGRNVAARVDIVPGASHLDPVLQLMMGGPLQLRVLDWIKHCEQSSSTSAN